MKIFFLILSLAVTTISVDCYSGDIKSEVNAYKNFDKMSSATHLKYAKQAIDGKNFGPAKLHLDAIPPRANEYIDALRLRQSYSYLDDRGANTGSDKFKQMSSADHLQYAKQAAEKNQFVPARTHLDAIPTSANEYDESLKVRRQADIQKDDISKPNEHLANPADLRLAKKALSELPPACSNSKMSVSKKGTVSLRYLCSNSEQSRDITVKFKNGKVTELH